MTGNLYPGDTDEHGLASLMVGRQVLFNTSKQEKDTGGTVLDVKGLTVMGSDGIEKVKNVDLSVKKARLWESQVLPALDRVN